MTTPTREENVFHFITNLQTVRIHIGFNLIQSNSANMDHRSSPVYVYGNSTNMLRMNEPAIMTDYTFDGYRGQCNVCVPKTYLSCPSSIYSHIQSAHHQQSLALHPEVRVLGPDGVKLMQLTQAGIRRLPAFPAQPVNNMYNNTALPPPGIHEDYQLQVDGRGQCFLCDCELKSRHHAHQHLMGRKHHKNKELKEKLNHAKIQNVYGLSLDQQLEAMHLNRRKNNSICDDSDGSESTTSSQSSYNKVGSPLDRMTIEQRYSLKGDQTKWIYCELCQVCVNSAEQAEVHKMGKKHRQKEESVMGVGLVPKSTNPATIRPVGHGRRSPALPEAMPTAPAPAPPLPTPQPQKSVNRKFAPLLMPTQQQRQQFSLSSATPTTPNPNAFGLKDLSVGDSTVTTPVPLQGDRVDEVALAIAYLNAMYDPFQGQHTR